MELTMPPRMLSYPRGVLGGAVPGTQETHDGQGTGVSEGREDKEVEGVGRFPEFSIAVLQSSLYDAHRHASTRLRCLRRYVV